MINRPIFRITFCVCLSVGLCFTQERPGALSFPESPYLLYHFVRSAAHISRTAETLDKKDGTGISLRDAFASTVGLTDADASALFSLALILDTQFQSLDAQATKLIADAKGAASNGLPPPPPSLAALQAQKTALIKTLKASVTQQLSSDGVSNLQLYLSRLSARHPGS